jgi:hypothetical protein
LPTSQLHHRPENGVRILFRRVCQASKPVREPAEKDPDILTPFSGREKLSVLRSDGTRASRCAGQQRHGSLHQLTPSKTRNLSGVPGDHPGPALGFYGRNPAHTSRQSSLTRCRACRMGPRITDRNRVGEQIVDRIRPVRTSRFLKELLVPPAPAGEGLWAARAAQSRFQLAVPVGRGSYLADRRRP